MFKRKKDRNLEKFHNEKVLFIVSINVPIFLLGAHITWLKLQSSFLFYPFLCFIYTLVFKNVAIWKKYMKLIHLSFFNQIFQCTFRFLIKRCFFLMRKQNADIWYIFQLQNFRKRVCIYIYIYLCIYIYISIYIYIDIYIYISMYVYLDSFPSFIQTINAYFYFFATSSYFKFYVNTTDTQVATNEDYL